MYIKKYDLEIFHRMWQWQWRKQGSMQLVPTICILFVFGQIIQLNIHIQPN